MSKLRVGIVAPSLRILGGQAVQADRLLRAWRDDPDVEAWLVPHNPLPPALLRFYLEEAGFGTIEVERISPAMETIPAVAELPAAVREALFGGLDYAIFARKM